MIRNMWGNEKWNFKHLKTHLWSSADRRTKVRKLLLGGFFIACVAILFPLPSFSKPKLDKDGNCEIPAECRFDERDSKCALIYCRGLREECKGDYSSGKCKEIKDLHDELDCSVAKKGCGDQLPRILTIGHLRVDISSGEVFFVTAPEDDAVDFSALFDAAAAAAAFLDPKICLERCLSKVSKECASACREICTAGQN